MKIPYLYALSVPLRINDACWVARASAAYRLYVVAHTRVNIDKVILSMY